MAQRPEYRAPAAIHKVLIHRGAVVLFCVLRMRHAGISSALSVMKSHTLRRSLFQVTVYGTNAEPFHDSGGDHLVEGLLSNGLLPPLIRQRLPSMIFHCFFRLPSEVLSGAEIQRAFFLFSRTVRRRYRLENRSQKLTLSQVRSAPSGQINTVGQAQPPAPQQHFGAADFQPAAPRAPERLAGMERSVHHSLSARSAAPFVSECRPADARRIDRPDFV